MALGSFESKKSQKVIISSVSLLIIYRIQYNIVPKTIVTVDCAFKGLLPQSNSLAQFM